MSRASNFVHDLFRFGHGRLFTGKRHRCRNSFAARADLSLPLVAVLDRNELEAPIHYEHSSGVLRHNLSIPDAWPGTNAVIEEAPVTKPSVIRDLRQGHSAEFPAIALSRDCACVALQTLKWIQGVFRFKLVDCAQLETLKLIATRPIDRPREPTRVRAGRQQRTRRTTHFGAAGQRLMSQRNRFRSQPRPTVRIRKPDDESEPAGLASAVSGIEHVGTVRLVDEACPKTPSTSRKAVPTPARGADCHSRSNSCSFACRRWARRFRTRPTMLPQCLRKLIFGPRS
jgi:hypothetical protein